MQVIDEITGKKISHSKCKTIVVNHIPGNIIFGYASEIPNEVAFIAYVNGHPEYYSGSYNMLKEILVYSVYRGCYISTVDCPPKVLVKEMYLKGHGDFPYSFNKRYEAIESFNIFNGRQEVLNPKKYRLSEYFKYSFGLEFETSMGYVPELTCFRDGLIPLRDGSISGLEYSTVVMSGDSGLSLLEQQLKTLHRYTSFNKECSLHIHFGGLNLTPDNIYKVYYLCKILEPFISKLVPPETFDSANYKANGKDYCRKLPSFRNFDQLYENLVGRKFFGSFTQPHPNDIRREAKWRIPTRYYWVNFINALCYNVNKTIEFRLLRPTYNFEKIFTWISIFNAILVYAEKADMNQVYRVSSLEDIMKSVYKGDFLDALMTRIYKLEVLTYNQVSNGDRIGSDIEVENSIFSLK